MSPARLSVDELPAWAVLNSVDLAHVRVQDIESKGCGLVACHDMLDKEATVDDDGGGPLLKLPRDCVLSAETVEECAKVNRNFRQLLESTGYQVTASNFPGFRILLLSDQSQEE
ncbi:hypothetical protein ESCO_002278 [Escovopsis weberi]|uniref:Uncharacterized protein n=1 Tax=Escovopsis weberi TaxID=150374 RepID=A0A0M8N6H8_ESCWE|nr:hypothetical protein ESCO_002278 [Escovopsis weberi]